MPIFKPKIVPKDGLCHENYFSMTFNVRLNAYISHERGRERVMLQALYLCAPFPLPISLYKAVGFYDRCMDWCGSEIGLVVLLFAHSLSGIFILCST